MLFLDAMTHANYPLSYKDGQDIRDRAFQFACRVVKFCERVYAAGGVGRMMVPQLVSSSTAPTGMLEEARAAESRRDFISKCCIGLKELRESWGRLRVMEACGIGPSDTARELVREANELVSIVTAIVRNTRQKNSDCPPSRQRNRRREREPDS